ncbi:hypothetical protein V5799_026164 [Amblyomma americanum]|uniref:BUD13 homolog n=1 Tax=Amblyomma americanum TaxID=6943 RepID=A0AAQ4DJC9_AMBAM
MASSGEVIAPVKSVDKLKYLEKYMSGKEKKKKKRTKASATQRLRILDDDVDLKQISSAHSREATPEDDEPAVASVIDERPLHARVAEQYTSAQWKKIGKDAGNEEVRGSSKQGRAADDSDESPPRKRHQACYRSRHDSDSDLSPERPGGVAVSPAKHGEPERNYRNRGSPPAEPVSKNSRHRSSPQKARQHSGSDTSPRRRPPSSPRSKRDKEQSPKKQRPTSSSSSSSKNRPNTDTSSSSHRHKKDQTSAYRGSSPERFYSDVSEVRVKVEPADATERKSIRNKSDGKQSRGHISPGEPPDSPQRAPGRRGRTEHDHRSSKHKIHKSDERHHSPQHKEVKVKTEPPSPRDDRDVRRSRVRHDSDSDLSPARVSDAPEDIDSDLSPRRCRTGDGAVLGMRGGSDSDLSPPRPGTVTKAHDRQGESDSDLSPVRPRKKSVSPVPVERHGSDSDLSPPRPGRRANSPARPAKQHRKQNSTADHKRQDRKASPPRSKHRSAPHVKVEKESPKRKGKEPEKVQEVVKLRDTSKADRAKEKAAKEAEMASIYSKWGKGLAQQEQQSQKLAEHLHEMAKPFSRYEGDEDLEKHLKDQEREGDPMLNYIRKKKKKADDTSGRPKYSGPEPPPNRYGIPPGYRWDGVDRSNGFEKKLIEAKNNKMATEEVAYKWSVEDL